jgi:hypothetical protein
MDIATWLRDFSLEHYAAIFRAADVDTDILGELSDADLERIGITSQLAANEGWSWQDWLFLQSAASSIIGFQIIDR